MKQLMAMLRVLQCGQLCYVYCSVDSCVVCNDVYTAVLCALQSRHLWCVYCCVYSCVMCTVVRTAVWIAVLCALQSRQLWCVYCSVYSCVVCTVVRTAGQSATPQSTVCSILETQHPFSTHTLFTAETKLRRLPDVWFVAEQMNGSY